MISDSFRSGDELRRFWAGDAGLMHAFSSPSNFLRQELFAAR
jgi:hypothetical protein